MLDRLKIEDFNACAGTVFRLCPEAAESLELLLEEVVLHRSTPRQETFSLFFRGPLAPALQQGTFPLAHERLGSFPLFLVPVAREEKGMLYEAVFNRLVKA